MFRISQSQNRMHWRLGSDAGVIPWDQSLHTKPRTKTFDVISVSCEDNILSPQPFDLCSDPLPFLSAYLCKTLRKKQFFAEAGEFLGSPGIVVIIVIEGLGLGQKTLN